MNASTLLGIIGKRDQVTLFFAFGDDVNLETEFFGSFFGVGEEQNGPILLVVFAFGFKGHFDDSGFPGLNRFFGKKYFGAGTGNFVIGNQQRCIPGVRYYKLVRNDRSFIGIRESKYRLINGKFRSLTHAESGIYY